MRPESEPDYDDALAHYCEYMSESYAICEVLGFRRDERHALVMERLESDGISPETLQPYEMILFDGGNIYGDAWKCIYFPPQKHFICLPDDYP